MRACAAGDPRIGKIPGARTSKSGTKRLEDRRSRSKPRRKHGAQLTSTLYGRSAWLCPAWRRALPMGHPRSRFVENCWHACLLIVRLSRVRLPFASVSTTAPNCLQRSRCLLRDRPLSQLQRRAGSPFPRYTRCPERLARMAHKFVTGLTQVVRHLATAARLFDSGWLPSNPRATDLILLR